MAFDTTATTVGFPFVEQAARLTRASDSPRHPAEQIETEFLISSRPATELGAEPMLLGDRRYWGIESGLHLRLDVSMGEDRSRVRHRTSALNLAMMRRAVVSVAVGWIKKCRKPRKATVSGFFDHMATNQFQRAFSLVTTRHSSALSTS